MPMNLLRILIFCCNDAGDISEAMLCFSNFSIVISFCMAHFRDGISLIPRYV